MFNLILYQPEIPPNTGNAIRLCANTGCKLHLIKPFAFQLDEKRVRRAGLDYRELAAVQEWDSLGQCLTVIGAQRWFAISTRGTVRFDQPLYQSGDAFVFGPETRGLPQEIFELCAPENRLRLPMVPDNRSLNLSNAVAVVAFEAWRQLGFAGGR
jgi:tRNA (cytidine/uridine-2'-O-)-methyltransferase